jgi:hypothetical protein
MRPETYWPRRLVSSDEGRDMGLPSNAQIDQAAETLCRIAEIPGFDRGRAIFKPDLRRVEWYSLEWGTQDFADAVDVEVHVPAACSYDNRGELFNRCRSEVMEGLFNRDAEVARMLPVWFRKAKEHEREDDPERLRAMAGALTDDVAERDWLERIGADFDPEQGEGR